MSTQSEREAAARAWWKDPSHDTAQALAEATRAVYAYACPQEGTLGTMLGALSLWMKWCREDAAKAAPAQPAAMTLEQMRDALVAAGATVVMPKVGGYERPDLALARAEASYMIVRCCDQMSHADKVAYDGEARGALIARLRALGVTPAVLS